MATLFIRGVSFEVEYDFSPACRGSRGSYGEPMEPDTDAEVELCSVRQTGADEGDDILCWISDELIDLLCEAALEYAESDARDAKDDAAINRYLERQAA